MKKPAVSIVLPVWNGTKRLPAAIDSVLNQTFRDFELIVVDDCSSDNSAAIADAYAASDARVRVLRNSENLKLPASLNRGFTTAKGSYLTWTSDDNILLLNMLERLVSELERTASDLVYADYEVFDSSGKTLERKHLHGPDDLFTYNWVGAAFLYRREAATRLGDYRTDLFCAEDYEYWLRFRTAGLRMTHVPELLYRYADNPDSLTATKRALVLERTARLKLEYADKFPAPARKKAKALYRLYRKLPIPELADAIKRLSPIFGRWWIWRLRIWGK